MNKPGNLNGFLDEGCSVEGTILFADILRIDGKVKGLIKSQKELIVGSTGQVEGELDVGILQISGAVKGAIQCREKCVIHRGGRLEGEITTPTLVIEEGAFFQGRCNMDGKNKKGV